MTRPEPLSVTSLARETAWVHGLARHLVHDEHLAADVAQDALVVGLGGAAPSDPDVPARGWLAGITRRLALQALRRRREREVRELLAARAPIADPEQRAVERLHVQEVLARAVRDLPEPYRTAVTLRFFEGRSPAAIARLRGQTPEAVRQHVHRGLGMLRKQLDREFGERRAWLALFGQLALGRPLVPWLPFAVSAPGLALGVVALVAAAIVVVLVWERGTSPVTPPTAGAMAPDPAAWSTAGGTRAVDAAPAPRGAETPQDPAAVAARVDGYLKALVQLRAFAGTVLVARGERVIVHESYGLADHAAGTANTVATRFKLMSVTKAITAVAVMRLVQQGKLGLEDPVAKYLPQWPAAWQEVTVHDLLDHTSRIANLEVEWSQAQREAGQHGLPAWPALAARLAARPLGRESAASYSNFNFELVGMVAEAASGKAYRQLMADEVFAPAGMQATGFDDGSRPPGLAVGYFFGADAPEASQQDLSMIQAAGGLWSTTGDLHRLDRALRGDALLTAATRARMTTAREGTYGYACGWSTQPMHGHRCEQHSGGANGFVADLLRFPDDDACVVVLSNYAFAPISRISNDVAALLFGVAVESPTPLTEEQLDASAGTFVEPTNAARRLVVRRAGGHLLAFDLWPGNERCSGNLLLPVGPGRFVLPSGDGVLAIDAKGATSPSGALVRREVHDAAWRALAGPLQMEPAIGERADLVVQGERLLLRIAGGWPNEVDVVAAGDDVAIGLVSASFGTLLHREGSTLRWTRADGTAVKFSPR